MSEQEWPPDWEVPDWGAACRVHDWKNHVSERVRALWASFSEEQKKALAAQADEQAQREEWE